MWGQGGEWGDAPTRQRCHLWHRDRDPGTSFSSCPPALCLTYPEASGLGDGDRQTYESREWGVQGREQRGK